jgi:cyclophilin family peptidyl-prolyl cis-trans isomerase
MKKIALIIPLLLIAVVYSCKKDKNTPSVQAPVPDFTSSGDSMKVTFTGTSTNSPTSWAWNFGDGTTGTGNPVTHTYSKEGAFTVTLTATNSGGSNSVSKSITVGVQLKLVKISTKFGDMVMWLYDETPQHKANFLKLTEQHFFDSTTFHRIIQDFMIQGGDPNSKDNDTTNDGYGGPGYTIPAEFRSDLTHIYGAVGAARDNNPAKASSGSQFYIVVDTLGEHRLDNNYTVFGQILSGMDVANTISVQPKNTNDRPLQDIRMSVTEFTMTRTGIKAKYGFDIK